MKSGCNLSCRNGDIMTHFLAERAGGSQAALINRQGTLITNDPQAAWKVSLLLLHWKAESCSPSRLYCHVYWRIVRCLSLFVFDWLLYSNKSVPQKKLHCNVHIKTTGGSVNLWRRTRDAVPVLHLLCLSNDIVMTVISHQPKIHKVWQQRFIHLVGVQVGAGGCRTLRQAGVHGWVKAGSP